jgi:hypothetical protein
MRKKLIIFIIFSCWQCVLYGQKDSARLPFNQLPAKYFNAISSRADKYYSSITSKTEKTLEKLARWEEKIHTLLQKASPETAQRLFGNNQLTFSALLKKYSDGKTAVNVYMAKYDEYRDKLTNTIKYLDEKREELNKAVVVPLNGAKEKINCLNSQLGNTETIEKFIKQRKKQLLQQAMQYIGKSKYLQKINKEAYYYFETLRNYKEIFSDPKKIEETAIKLLKKIPAFNEFLQKNSMLASLFGFPGGNSNPNGTVGLLQSRAMVQMAAQNQLRAGGPNPQQVFQQAMQLAQGQLNQLRQQVAKWGGGDSDFDIPDFVPNSQKSKKFLQKIELSANIQNAKHNSVFPFSSDIGFSAGYKPNNKLIAGIGGSYRIGWGSLDNIKITHQGVGLRSFLDWKIRGGLYISGGYEQNYFSEIRNIQQLRNYSAWKSSALLGISKKYNIGKKKKGEMKLLYDFFSQTKVPKTSAVLFRIGFGL